MIVCWLCRVCVCVWLVSGIRVSVAWPCVDFTAECLCLIYVLLWYVDVVCCVLCVLFLCVLYLCFVCLYVLFVFGVFCVFICAVCV